MSGLGDSAQLQYAATRPARRCSWRLQTGFAKGDQNKTVASVRVLENGCGDLEPGSGLVPEHGASLHLRVILSTRSIHDAMWEFKRPGVCALCQDVNHDRVCGEPIVEAIAAGFDGLELELSLLVWYVHLV